MRILRHCRQFLTIIALAGAIAPLTARAEDIGRSRTLFACSAGVDRVTVTKVGKRLTYTFKHQGQTELTITGDAQSGAVFYRRTTFPHAEHQQLRFRRGAFSYVIFNRWAAPDYDQRGAEDFSGLLVLRGRHLLRRIDCKRGGEFIDGPDFFDWDSLPSDPEDLIPGD